MKADCFAIADDIRISGDALRAHTSCPSDAHVSLRASTQST